MTKSADVCHDCAKDKGILDIMSGMSWKVWNQSSKTWVKPEN